MSWGVREHARQRAGELPLNLGRAAGDEAPDRAASGPSRSGYFPASFLARRSPKVPNFASRVTCCRYCSQAAGRVRLNLGDVAATAHVRGALVERDEDD